MDDILTMRQLEVGDIICSDRGVWLIVSIDPFVRDGFGDDEVDVTMMLYNHPAPHVFSYNLDEKMTGVFLVTHARQDIFG